MRGSPRFLSWIDRCEETINHFLTHSKIDSDSIIRLREEETSNESDSLNPARYSRQKPLKLRESLLEEKINVMVMGKLNTVGLCSVFDFSNLLRLIPGYEILGGPYKSSSVKTQCLWKRTKTAWHWPWQQNPPNYTRFFVFTTPHIHKGGFHIHFRCSNGGLQLPQCPKEFLGIFGSFYIKMNKCNYLHRGQWLTTQTCISLVIGYVM